MLYHYHEKNFSRHRLFYTENAETCAVFIHGLNGDSTTRYWSLLDEFLRTEELSGPHNFLFFGYESTLRIFPNALTLPTRRKRIASVEEITQSLVTLLRSNEFKNISRFLLFGHSLGGLVALGVAYQAVLDGEPSVSRVCLCTTPTEPPMVAKLANTLSLSSNPHFKFLSNKREYDLLFSQAMPHIRAKGVDATYMRGIGDEVVGNFTPANFDQTIYHEENHSWVSQIQTRSNEGYKNIVEWINK